MALKNITLKTAELGPVLWENVEKLLPGETGFICFVSAEETVKENMEGDQTTHLIGTYFETYFDYLPSYKEVINFLITSEYPNGKELQMLRLGVSNPNDPKYLEYYEQAEDIRSTIKSLLS